MENNDVAKSEYFILKCIPYLSKINTSISATVYSRLSVCRLRQNDIDGAKQYKIKAIEVSSDELVQYENKVDLCYINSFKNPKEALTQYAKLKSEMEDGNLIDTKPYLHLIDYVIIQYYNNNEIKKVLSFLTDSRKIAEKKLNENNYVISYLNNAIGVCYLHLNEPKKGLSFFFKYKTYLESMNKDESYDYALACHNIGRAYMLMGEKEMATQNLVKSRDLQIKIDGVASNRTLQYLLELGINE